MKIRIIKENFERSMKQLEEERRTPEKTLGEIHNYLDEKYMQRTRDAPRRLRRILRSQEPPYELGKELFDEVYDLLLDLSGALENILHATYEYKGPEGHREPTTPIQGLVDRFL